jgi:hypothetical protein
MDSFYSNGGCLHRCIDLSKEGVVYAVFSRYVLSTLGNTTSAESTAVADLQPGDLSSRLVMSPFKIKSFPPVFSSDIVAKQLQQGL